MYELYINILFEYQRDDGKATYTNYVHLSYFLKIIYTIYILVGRYNVRAYIVPTDFSQIFK